MSKILFEEKQRFTQAWIWLILAGINILFLYGMYKQLILGVPFGDKPMSDSGLIVFALFLALITVFFACIRLHTRIEEDGIYVRFFPFHLRYKRYPWQVLDKAYVRAYSPLREYGGWGLRRGLFGKGSAYNISGNKGLQLEFSDNRRLLIGTKRPDELTEALRHAGYEPR